VRALTDRALRARLGAAGLARVRERFTVDRMVEQTAIVYERVNEHLSSRKSQGARFNPRRSLDT
jgi:hypothetical protein